MRPPAARARRDRAAEALVWIEYARTIKPLPGRPALPPALPPSPTAPPHRLDPTPPNPSPERKPVGAARHTAVVAVGTQPSGIDTGSWQRFRSGRVLAERTLDLHGRTAQRAHGALLAFLHAAHADGVRCVEIITGRGSGEAGGVIRRELPLWLNLPTVRPLILAAAHPHPQNPGSTRILLRRLRA